MAESPQLKSSPRIIYSTGRRRLLAESLSVFVSNLGDGC
jgi:hypothetical protein